MKPTENYKMRRITKVMLCTMPGMTDSHHRAQFKKMMIKAELHAASVDRVVIGSKSKNTNDE
jgi:hypothetical protein